MPDWMRTVSKEANPVLARFRGSPTFSKEDFVGFTFVPDLPDIRYFDNAGRPDSPTTSDQPVAMLTKHSNVTGSLNPAQVVQHNIYGTSANDAGQASFFETIIRAGGAGVFGEGIRTHCITPDGIVGGSFGAVAYAYNGGAGLNNIGLEAYIIRGTSTDCPVGRSWTSADQLDGGVAITAQTKTLSVGGTGGKPAAGVYINMFNTIAVQTGFWVPKSVVGGKTVAHTAFGCQEVGLTYGLDLALGSYSSAAIALPNSSKITAYNGAGSAELEILKYDSSNVLVLNGGNSGSVKFGTFTSNADAAVNGYVTIIDSSGTTRKLATIA
jgi:hypothetical protein